VVEHRDEIRIFLLEDHAVIRSCSAFVLEREPDLEVVATAGSLEEARKSSASKRWPEVDIALIGLLLPDGIGTDLIADLRKAKPGLPVIVHTVLTQREAHRWAIEMGANEVISKQSPLEELVAAIKRLGGGGGGGNRAEPNPPDHNGRR
jgi:DNA-binding NarL/FixJ family response regulator